MSNGEKIGKGEELLKVVESIDKFSSKYGVYPGDECEKIIDEMRGVAGYLPDVKEPSNNDDLMGSELKRRLLGGSFNLETMVRGAHYDYDMVIDIFGIPREDLANLRPWLDENREKTLESIQRLFHSRNIASFELPVSMDVPSVRRQAEEVGADFIRRYHKTLGKYLESLTNVGRYMVEIDAVPTNDERSYFNLLTKTLAIGLPRICYFTEDGLLRMRERELIDIYGHEGMGHALNQVVTDSNNLPYFLTKGSTLTTSTAESVAQFYQKILLEDLENSPDTQRALDIVHKFKEIAQEARDVAGLEEYKSKQGKYAITVLADKSLGDPNSESTIKRKTELLSEVALPGDNIRLFVEAHRFDYDSAWNLKPSMVGELRYSAEPVSRALNEFEKQGIRYDGPDRSVIDMALLKGFWTPVGFVDNARLVARDYKPQNLIK